MARPGAMANQPVILHWLFRSAAAAFVFGINVLFLGRWDNAIIAVFFFFRAIVIIINIIALFNFATQIFYDEKPLYSPQGDTEFCADCRESSKASTINNTVDATKS